MNPSVADIEKIRRKIAKLTKDTPAIRIGGMTDGFQPIGKRYHVTYETIKALNERRIPYLIVTKGAIVADDEYIELVEFLSVNTWIRKWFDIDYSEYTVKQSGYNHLPLKKKLEYIKNINGFKEMTVCEDESEAYEYWKNNFNYNPNDCCNLRIA